MAEKLLSSLCALLFYCLFVFSIYLFYREAVIGAGMSGFRYIGF